MGRRDAVQAMLEIVAECRRLLPGLIVTWEPGWETRGNGTSANYSYGSIHHTASASSEARPFPTQGTLRNGRSDLPGPLCNVAQPWCTVQAPRLHVMAAHPANHGGASRASGPVPALSLFNPTSIGDEIDYAGTVAMSAGQLLVGHVVTRAVANVLAKGNVEVVRGHFETSVTGKWDPGYASGKSYDMAAWRRTAAAIGGPLTTGDDVALNEWEYAVLMENNKMIKDAVSALRDPITSVINPQAKLAPRDMLAAVDGAAWTLVNRTLPALAKENAALRATQQELVAAIGKLAQGDDLDEEALLARIDGKLDEIKESVSDAAKLVQVKVSVEDAPDA